MSADERASTEDAQREAARLAGWDGTGPVPEGHGMPPPDDPALGNNGIAPTDAKRIA